MSELVKETMLCLGDLQLKLKFNFRAILIFEKHTGKSFFKLGGELSATEIITLLWAMATAAGQTLTVEKIADKVSLKDMSEVQRVLESLIKEGLPEPKEPNVSTTEGVSEKNV